MKRVAWLTLALLFFLFAGKARAYNPETILSFDSRITVREDASLSVTETITVEAANIEIRHGIYRDFPTQYRDTHGLNYRVGFKLLNVSRDGYPEPYHTEQRLNGIRIYAGDKNSYVSPGRHTYVFNYQTSRQLGFFKDHDELYWNVTGNGWTFPMQDVSAQVILPQNARVLETEAYTGYRGAKERNFNVIKDDSGVLFRTTKSLLAKQGLTIVVSWPKGYVKQPTDQEKLGYFIDDNKGKLAALFGLLVIFAYYFYVWNKVGRDPPRGPIVPLFHPPADLTPADVRYIMTMKFDHKAFAATIVSMAVKRFLKIEVKGSEYTLRKTGGPELELSDEERNIAATLLTGDKFILKDTHYSQVQGALHKLESTLKDNFLKKMFFTNNDQVVKGVIVSLAAVGLSGFCEADSIQKLVTLAFMSVWLSIWTLGICAMTIAVILKWKDACRGNLLSLGSAVFHTVIALPFFIGEIFGLSVLYSATSLFFVIFVFLTALVNFLFAYLMKAPTVSGRRIMDQIEGFKMYLSATEKDRIEKAMSDTKTPELYEKYLPYAIALDVERAWSDHFTDVFKSMEQNGQNYSPIWYSGIGGRSFFAGSFSDGLASGLTSSIASSSTAPGSSSGGGGGGSSGGGGGGGGGGGW